MCDRTLPDAVLAPQMRRGRRPRTPDPLRAIVLRRHGAAAERSFARAGGHGGGGCQNRRMSLVLVEISRADGATDGPAVATLTLNNPQERNTLTAPMVAEIIAAMDDIEADASVGAVIVTGAAPAFCAGANLGNLAEATEDSLGSIYEGFLRIARSPLPTLAAVNGAAVGAGMNLALGCDVRVAARRARFDTRFLQIGIHPGGGHTWMLRRIAGPQTTVATVVFGEVMDG